jgi:hypothetical protein
MAQRVLANPVNHNMPMKHTTVHVRIAALGEKPSWSSQTIPVVVAVVVIIRSLTFRAFQGCRDKLTPPVFQMLKLVVPAELDSRRRRRRRPATYKGSFLPYPPPHPCTSLATKQRMAVTLTIVVSVVFQQHGELVL